MSSLGFDPRHRTLAALALLAASWSGCRATLPTSPCQDAVTASAQVDCAMEAYEERGYTLLVPDDYDGSPRPLLVAMHGGGGDRMGFARIACPDGDLEHPACLHQRALDAGMVVVLPDGTGSRLMPNTRTWNSGGGVDDWRCTAGRACEEDIDDVAYTRALLEHVRARVAVDPARVYLTGLSNGGAMSHRLACAMADQIAAIAPVGGAMQALVAPGCAPSQPVPVLHVHGTEDPCWRFEGGAPDCAWGLTGQAGKRHVSVMETMEAWARANGCDDATDTTLVPDTEADGAHTELITWRGCAAETTLAKVVGGGHTWPSGDQYLGEGAIGPVWTDWDSRLMLDWLLQHTHP